MEVNKINRLAFFTIPYFSTRLSRSSSVCYGQPSCFRRPPPRFLRLRISAWDLLGVNFILVKGFCVGFVESPRDFFRVLIFNPIRSSLSLEIRSNPLGKNSSLWGGTYLYGLYMGVILPPSPLRKNPLYLPSI